MTTEFIRTPVPYCQIFADWNNDFSQCLHEWQGLLSGGLALAAALIGAIFLSRQTKSSMRMYQDNLKRRNTAAKTLISSILKEFSITSIDLALKTISISVKNSPIDKEEFRKTLFFRDLIEAANDQFNINSILNFSENLDNEKESHHLNEIIVQINDLKYNFLKFIAEANTNENISKNESTFNLLLSCSKILFISRSASDHYLGLNSKHFPFEKTDNYSAHWKVIKNNFDGFMLKSENNPALKSLITEQLETMASQDTSPWVTI